MWTRRVGPRTSETPGFSPVSTISSVAAFGFKVIVAALVSGHFPAVVDIRGTKNVTLLMLGVCAYVRLAAPFDLESPCASAGHARGSFGYRQGVSTTARSRADGVGTRWEALASRCKAEA